jgi:hypothetical protein
MSLRDLLVLYAVIGLACAIAVLRNAPGPRVHAVVSAVMTIPLWPIWAPFALSHSPPRRAATTDHGAVLRIQRALAEAVEAVANTPMAEVFSRQVAARISAEVGHVAARLDELSALASRTGFDAEASAARLRDLENRGDPERALATARMQHESLLRLQQLRAGDARALEELADLMEALRTQLVLARYAGSSAEGVGAIVSEVWARLEGLGAAFDGVPTPTDIPPDQSRPSTSAA